MTRPQGVVAITAFAAAIAVTWPAITGAGFSQRDALFTAINQQHLAAALSGRGGLWDSPLAAPIPDGTAQADWVLGQAIVGAPLGWFGVDPMQTYALVAVAGLALTAAAAGWISEALVGRGSWSCFAIVGGLSVVQVAHAQHTNLVWHAVPLAAVACLVRAFHRDDRRAAAAGTALVGVSFQFGLYLGLHATLMAVVVVGAAAYHRRVTPALLGSLGAGAGLSAVMTLPVLARYAAVATRTGAALAPGELEGESVDLARLLAPIPGAPLHAPLEAWWPPLEHAAVDVANPGYVVAALAVVGGVHLLRDPRRSWVWTAVFAAMVVAGVLSLGPSLQFGGHAIGPAPMRALLWIPGVDATRAPARWLAVVFLGAGLLAAVGGRVLISRSRWWYALIPLSLAELTRADAPPPLTVPDAYQLVGSRRDIAAYFESGGPDGCSAKHRLAITLRTGVPAAGGHFARRSTALDAVNRMVHDWPAPAADTFLRASGFRWVLLHPPFPSIPPDARCVDAHAHRLCALPAPAPTPAVRISRARPDGTVILHCADGLRTVDATPWQTRAEVLEGANASFDVPVDRPCELRSTIPVGGAWVAAPTEAVDPAP